MADLQGTTELVSELTSKLAELDGKVAAYRLDMAAEFTKHSEEALRSVPEDVAYRVSQAITESLANFPSLYPPGSLSSSLSPTPTDLGEKSFYGRKSPPPILPHTSGSPKDPLAAILQHKTRGPHERELEFQGLFIPTYLPLLEKVDRPQHTAPASVASAPASSGAATPSSSGAGPSAALAPAFPNSVIAKTASLDSQLGPEDALSPEHSRHRGRPSPLRRATNTSVDSAVSDSSSVKTRKSALRRLSGSSKPPDSPRDPRRVRFDFQGQEVLPSSSPQTSTALPEAVDITSQPAPVEEPYVTSLGDVKGEEDEDQVGLPKKVSSTQALRALSKAPLDEGTVWTIVNTETPSEASSSSDTIKVRRNTATNASSQVGTQGQRMNSDKVDGLPKEHGRDQVRGQAGNNGGPSQPRTVRKEKYSEEEDSEDEANVLFMMSKKGGQKPPLPVSSRAASRQTAASLVPIQAGSYKQATAPAASPMPMQAGSYKHAAAPTVSPMPIASSVPTRIDVLNNNATTESTGVINQAKADSKGQTKKSTTHDEDDDEAFFDFDHEEENDEVVKQKHTKSGKKISKFFLTNSSDDESDTDAMTAEVPADENKSPTNDPPFSSSIDISDRRVITPEYKVPSIVPRKPEGTRSMSTSIGTYDGKPVTPHVVKNKALRDQIKNEASDVPFFVGSVNGNSGVDASNAKSYQASVMSPSNASGAFASGSFAERLMWERSQGLTYDSDGEDKKADKAGDKTVGDKPNSGEKKASV